MSHVRRPARGTVRLIAVVAATLLTVAGCSSGTLVRGLPGKLPTAPVLLVHGYNAASCPGADVTHAQWGSVYLALTKAGWRGPILPVSYYECDHDGVDITGYGRTVPAGATAAVTAGTPRVHYDQNTSIDQIAQDLGWFVYHSYGRTGTAVDLVGISMGGLIIRDLLYRVSEHDPRFPPRVVVTRAVTFSTPYRGYGGTGTSSICPVVTTECVQFAVGSTFISMLTADAKPPQGDGGTSWAAAGSSAGCDLVPTTSSLGLPGAERIDYLKPCYAHTAYLYDNSEPDDASAKITEPDGSTTSTDAAPHSLNWLVTTLTGK